MQLLSSTKSDNLQHELCWLPRHRQAVRLHIDLHCALVQVCRTRQAVCVQAGDGPAKGGDWEVADNAEVGLEACCAWLQLTQLHPLQCKLRCWQSVPSQAKPGQDTNRCTRPPHLLRHFLRRAAAGHEHPWQLRTENLQGSLKLSQGKAASEQGPMLGLAATPI